jgi:hypothetical protein
MCLCEQDINGCLAIAFCRSRNDVHIHQTSGCEHPHGARQQKIQDRGASRCYAIKMCVKSIVKEDIVGANSKPASASAFLILAAEHHRSIGTSVSMCG